LDLEKVMSTRLTVFAVDMEVFGRVVEMPLWHLLVEVRKQLATEEAAQLCILGMESQYLVKDGKFLWVRDVNGKRLDTWVTEPALREVPELQQGFRQFVSTGSSGHVKLLLQYLQFIDGRRFAQTLTEGLSPSWLRGVLHVARRDWKEMPWFVELERYIERMLKLGPGILSTGERVQPIPSGFAVFPEDNIDTVMSVLQEEEFARLLELFEMLMRMDVRYEAPIRFNTGAEDWTAWVRTSMEQFLRARSFGMERPGLIAFGG
jgi:hypothetical protein